jgi:hypothetical protein
MWTRCILLLALPLIAASAPAQNLLVSPDFDVASDVDDWPDPFPDADTDISWSSTMDVGSSTSSGSLRLETRISNGAADGPFQCVESGVGSYEVSAWVFNPTQSPQPQGFVSLDYYPNSACSGPLIGSDDAFWSGALDAWDEISFMAVAPAGTASVGMRLFSGNTVDPTPVAVFYDAVFLPEPAGPMGALVGGLALAVLHRLRRRR